ncbi:MAG: hypothetical protein RhofKO_04830 [Rhodothermales bacterium]
MVDDTTLPNGVTQTADPDGGNDDMSDVTLAGTSNLDQDFGYKPSGSIGDTVFADDDGNGNQNGGEAGIPGIEVGLYQADGTTPATDSDGNPLVDVTDTQGTYLFTMLIGGDYVVVVNPNGTTPPPGQNTADPDGGFDSQSAVTIPSGGVNLDQDFGYQQPKFFIDLELAKSVNDPAPEVGDVLTYTLEIVNKGNTGATGVELTDIIPAGLTFLGPVNPAFQYTQSGNEITWTVPDFGYVGCPSATCRPSSYTIEYQVSVDQEGTFVNKAEVTAADQEDIDSQPGEDNVIPDQDDEDIATVTTDDSSGGGGGGVESDGNMASKLAQRLFERRQDAMFKRALREAPAPIVMTSQARSATLFADKGSSSIDLARLVPEEGPQNSQAMVVTPDDLLGLTNATSVFSVDYLRTDGRRMGAILGLTSPGGSLYDHTKNTCDRLGGGRLDAVRTVMIDERPYVLSTLIHGNGQIDHAVSFVAYRTGNSYVIDSRFAPDAYTIPAGTEEVLNFQIWSVSASYTQSLVADVIGKLSESGSVSFVNEVGVSRLPSLYIHSGRYQNGQLILNMVNTTGKALAATLDGSLTLTESDAQNLDRGLFNQSIIIPAPARGEQMVEVVIPTGDIYDVAFSIEAEGAVVDRVYWADGPWGINSGEAEVNTFETYVNSAPVTEDGVYRVARDAYVGGTVTDYVSLFRFLRPAAQPVDLSAYTHLEFTAYGQGQVSMFVEKAAITDGDQFGTSFRLSSTPRRLSFALEDLRQGVGGLPFTAEDLTAVVFYVTGNGQSAQSFDFVVEDMAFTGAASTVAIEDEAEAPQGFALSQNYPNPFNPSTTIGFSVPETQAVTLTVYDMLGRVVRTLVNDVIPAGAHEVSFEAGDLSSGTYLYRLQAGERSIMKTLLLMK